MNFRKSYFVKNKFFKCNCKSYFDLNLLKKNTQLRIDSTGKNLKFYIHILSSVFYVIIY